MSLFVALCQLCLSVVTVLCRLHRLAGVSTLPNATQHNATQHNGSAQLNQRSSRLRRLGAGASGKKKGKKKKKIQWRGESEAESERVEEK